MIEPTSSLNDDNNSCRNCGTTISRDLAFCAQCGVWTTPPDKTYTDLSTIIPLDKAPNYAIAHTSFEPFIQSKPPNPVVLHNYTDVNHASSDIVPLRHSSAGKASLTIACVAFFYGIISIPIGLGNISMFFSLFLLGVVILFTGIITGFVGLFQSNCNKRYASLGILFGFLIPILLFGWLGLLSATRVGYL